jgi:hypothetical protein
MKNLNLFLILVLAFIFHSCEKEIDNETNLTLDKVSGFVQKGPFLNGTAITISELSDDLTPTGKNFTSQILDNKGTFEIRNVNLSSQYVELKADGFYFNEVSNSNSSAQLTLFALSDLSNKSTLNVNIISNLEKNRVDYLVSNGTAFSVAKNQAQTEILSIFEISSEGISESEQLDILESGDDNAILLAVSVILQGYLSVSELSELLANISTDIREDGQLNSQTLGSTLINNARTIKLADVRANLESRCEELGLATTVPDFEKFVNQFIDNTDFEFTGFIKYPETGKHGINILDKERTNYSAGTYSMNAILPEGTSLKVKLSGQNWFYRAFQDNSGWEHSDWNDTDNSRIFTATRTGEVDFEILFKSYQDTTWSNNVNIFVYENNDLEPTWSKEIIVE